MSSLNSSEYKKSVLRPWSQDASKRAALQSAVAGFQADSASEEFLSLDLRTLFAVPGGTLKEGELQDHAQQLEMAFNKAKTLPSAALLKKLMEQMSAQEMFMDPSFWAGLHQKQNAVQQERLVGAVADLRAETPLGAMSRSQASKRLAALGLDGVDPGLLAKQGIRVFEDLPAPDPQDLGRVRSTWKRIRDQHSAEYQTIFDLLVLDRGTKPSQARCVDELSVEGRRVTPQDVENAHRRTQSLKDSNAVQDAQKFLAELKKVSDSESLRRIVLATVWEQAGEAVFRGTPALRVKQNLCGLGIEENDAVRIVASVSEHGAAAPSAPVGVDSVRQHLADGQLNQAKRTLEALEDDPKTAEDRQQLAGRIAALEATKSTAMEAYREAAEKGDYAVAEARLQEVLKIDGADSQAADLLGRLPLPAPRISAGSADGGVALSWDTADDAAQYTVYRSSAGPLGPVPTGTPIAKDLARTTYQDSDAPAGNQLYYAVVAARPGGLPSAAGQAQVLHLPAPEGLETRSSESDIRLSWQVVPQAVAVRIRRTTAGADQEVFEVKGTNTFRTQDVEVGRTYRFELTAVYLTSEGAQESPAVSAAAIPRGEAKPVADLYVEPGSSDGSFEARWSQSEEFVTELWAVPAAAGDPPAPGTVFRPVAERGSALKPLRAECDFEGAGRVLARISSLEGLHFVVPMTCVDSGFLVGTPALAGSAPSVRRPKADVLGNQIRLTWEWPEGNYVAEVRWSTSAQSRSRRVTKAKYRRDGGVFLSEPSSVSDLSVSTVARSGDDEWVSGRVAVAYAAPVSTEIRYTAKIVRPLFGPARVELEVTGSGGSSVQHVGVYLRRGSTIPITAEQAELVTALDIDCSSGAPASHSVGLGRIKGPFWVRLFAPDGGAAVLDPPTSQLKG